MINTTIVSRLLSGASQVLWAIVLGLILVAPGRAALLEDIEAPLLVIESGESLLPAVLTATHLEMSVVGTSVEIQLRQVFANPGEEWVNALYVMPLPDGAAVTGLTLELDDRRITGQIRERAVARDEFVAASDAGQRASLLEQVAPDLFNLRVANVPPGGAVVVDVSVAMTAEREGAWWSIRFPTTVTPRYRAAGATHQGVSPEFAAIAHPLSYALNLRGHGRLARVDTPLHESQMQWRGGTLEIKPMAEAVAMDRDLVLRWQLAQAAQPTPSLLVQESDGSFFAELMLVPPAPEYLPVPAARDLLFVLDVSGSMAGTSIEQAVAAVETALANLTPQDRFDVITFSSHTTALFDALVPASPGAVQAARRFLSAVRAEGGTEMQPALMTAFDYPPVDDGVLRQVLFITDGAVHGEVELFRLIEQHLGVARLFTVAIGTAPNSGFMRQAASLGRGVHRHISSLSDVEGVLTELLTTISRPVVTDIDIVWPQAVELAQTDLPDVYLNQSLLQRVRLEVPPVGGEVQVYGLMDGRPWEAQVTLPGPFAPVTSGRALSTLWARARIDATLDDALVLGHGLDSVRDSVLALGLAHQLITPFTSFVATEQRVTRAEEGDPATKRIPAMPPAGSLGYAQTGTASGLWLYGGLFALMTALLLVSMRREEGSHDPALDV